MARVKRFPAFLRRRVGQESAFAGLAFAGLHISHGQYYR